MLQQMLYSMCCEMCSGVQSSSHYLTSQQSPIFHFTTLHAPVSPPFLSAFLDGPPAYFTLNFYRDYFVKYIFQLRCVHPYLEYAETWWRLHVQYTAARKFSSGSVGAWISECEKQARRFFLFLEALSKRARARTPLFERKLQGISLCLVILLVAMRSYRHYNQWSCLLVTFITYLALDFCAYHFPSSNSLSQIFTILESQKLLWIM